MNMFFHVYTLFPFLKKHHNNAEHMCIVLYREVSFCIAAEMLTKHLPIIWDKCTIACCLVLTTVLVWCFKASFMAS